MNKDTFDRKKSALSTLLEQMDVPEMRKQLRDTDIRWLNRNLGIRNKNHPMFETTIGLVTWLLKNK